MTNKANIDPQVRGFYFSQSGSSRFDGATFERPKATMQQAIDEAAALVPIPNPTAIAVISSAQGGTFNNGFTLVDSVQFDGRDVSILASEAVIITLASSLSCSLTSIVNTFSGGTCFKIDTEFNVGIDVSFIGVFATGTAVEVTGVCDDIFLVLSQIFLGAPGAVALDITSTTTTPIDVDINNISMVANDTTFLNYNPVSATDDCVLNVSEVNKNGTTGGEAFMVRSGHLTVRAGLVDVDTVLHVFSGAEMDFNAQTVTGDIIVDAGCILNVIVMHHESGTITNNGTINGIIGSDTLTSYFGTYRQKHAQEVVLNASSFSTQTPTGTDTPLQLEFGAAQFGSSDPVEIDASGNITINQTDQYNVSLILQYGRTNAGSFSLMFFRLLVDGTQFGPSRYAKLDNANADLPVQFTGPLDLVTTEVLTVELIRDSAGFDDGELFAETVTDGWNAAPSASIILTRNRLVQPEIV